ncbi:oxidized purine nucleoside triphosphate hydrolase-like isoform X1 [Schistocerca americana]|uniref:oxidized purine nucleoside triphosphate hydrolase-like isoform X1 n=1 Tax=Schistocerca americana TaxID=7009 RepID=UPI001F502996|nr:oxidized purine nucleoside triphosphate hydrolase-like isoform X1 [Schistocerca americana]XP_046991093.1 oxidized purine nucleoside triphosphate hydrolase-like isoform X1 [Schistocerca americana]
MFRKLLTLVIVQRDREILLGLKKRGFGKGKWNGFGGKVEPGETIQCAAARELQEESGLTALDLKHVGVIEFEFVGDLTILEVHVFKTHKWSGNVSESDDADSWGTLIPSWGVPGGGRKGIWPPLQTNHAKSNCNHADPAKGVGQGASKRRRRRNVAKVVFN